MFSRRGKRIGRCLSVSIGAGLDTVYYPMWVLADPEFPPDRHTKGD